MKICVIYPKVCCKSGALLASALGADKCNMSISDKRDFTEYDVVFSFGSSARIKGNTIINSSEAICNCIDKRTTLRILKENNIPSVAYVLHREDIPDSWDIIVARIDSMGNQAKSLDFYTDKKDAPIAELYTEYFEHEFEMRIVVFQNRIVGRYIKEQVGEAWEFVEAQSTGLKVMDNACIKAAAVLGIDYVGFDVVAKDCEDFAILEANSGATLTDGVAKSIKKYLKGN